MLWMDRVYGQSEITDPDLLSLIATPTFQRLKGIRQAGPSAFAHPFKTVTRFEHSLGVYTLLTRLGAGRKERVAGLLHDLSHTAFSHAVDFVFASEDQAYHETLKPIFLARPDIKSVIEKIGYATTDFEDDTVYTLLERPLPLLCADRLDYFLRDGRACGVCDDESIAQTLSHIVAVDGLLCLTSLDVARDVVARFAEMNRAWWAGPTESFIYNEFADALREGLLLGCLKKDDLLSDDEHVLACLRSARNSTINS
ncbi:MAG TPA: HD domain-containing protein, partial [Isosphaeraceae bacterium]|nr:HD domain-containing protein [Isosphaeraceae bacterium]